MQTHTQTHNDKLTDGTQHLQRCERTASMKQMGAKGGNEEVKRHMRTQTNIYKQTHTHTKYTLTQWMKGETVASPLGRRDSKITFNCVSLTGR